MTAKRDSEKAKPDKRPKLKKETLKDLDASKQGDGVKGGAPIRTRDCAQPTNETYCACS